MSFKVIQPGILSLIQDGGRLGKHRIGLTTGGALDKEAFQWANRLCGNDLGASALEIGFGGLTLEAQVDTTVVLTGAVSPFKINGKECAQWQTQTIQAGQRLEVGFSTQGTRAYLAVKGGFNIEASFDSTATVVREGIGGLAGSALQAGDILPCDATSDTQGLRLSPKDQPKYGDSAILRVILGYQQDHFSPAQQQLFFNSEYKVTDRADRMGFRLEGAAIKADIDGILSEGICHGAIQIPADGQPIVLMNDRQTIGGYPKIGSVIALDTGKLAQLRPGASIRFEAISVAEAHNLHCLAQARFDRITPLPL